MARAYLALDDVDNADFYYRSALRKVEAGAEVDADAFEALGVALESQETAP